MKNQEINGQLKKPRKTVGMISLGCDKNRVDSEKILAFLADDYEISNDAAACEILIINTCAFLESAREEAINTVFEYVNLKSQAKLEKIIMTGCLPQKYIGELFDELTEVDAFLGTFDQSLIKLAIQRAYETGERLNFVGKGKELASSRFLTTPPHYAYLKIADGCNNHCTYCLIPKIRGAYRSYPMENLIAEAKALGGVRELILVAQDTTRYGEDFGENKFVELLRALTSLDNIGSVRIMYAYPEKITDELIYELKTNPKLVKYLDVPLQHADDGILKLMNRKGSFQSYIELIRKLRREVAGVAIRSTFITGFPTETEAQHERLKEFLRAARLNGAGFFTYSREPETAAYKLKGQIPEAVKLRRQEELYAVQTQIASGILSELVGKNLEVVCDGIDYEKQAFFGRAYFSAPDIDGLVYFTSDEVVKQGETYTVRVLSAEDLDLYGETLK